MGYHFETTPEDLANPRGHNIRLVCIVAPIITTVFILARAYANVRIVRRVGVDDWVAYFTLPFTVAFSVTLAQATNHGMGLHQDVFKEYPDLSRGYYFWVMVSSEPYCVALAGYKSALLLLYLKLFGVSRTVRYLCYFFLFFTNAYLLSNLITEVAGCHPIQKFWDSDLPGSCIVLVASEIAYGACNVISDLAIAILPLPLIWKMQVSSRRDKVGLTIVLGTGAVAFVVAMVRYIYSVIDLTSTDRTWVAGDTFFWAVLEVNTGLICSCTPAMKPFLRYIIREGHEFIARRSSASTERANLQPEDIQSPAPMAMRIAKATMMPFAPRGQAEARIDSALALTTGDGSVASRLDSTSTSNTNTSTNRGFGSTNLLADNIHELDYVQRPREFDSPV